ncbi:ABC transporter substrate-binding protein [Kineococcus arenarius]|uniref:ABC transporter substrate-binding protein n=1 Tax=Kineococcus sp. SYSU DK007 TaxID=3383128 RepID=UPI003D7EE349
MSRSHPPTRRLVLGASAAALLAGCANDADTTPATGEDAMTLAVGQISDSVAFFPLFVAEDQGYFTDEGLTLGDRPRLGTGAKLAAAVQSGSIDVAAGVMTDAFNLYGNNPDARVVGSLVNAYYVDVIAGNSLQVSADAPLEEKVQALRGRNIGMTGPGSGTEALLTYLFTTNGMDPATDAVLVNLGADPSAAIGALEAGRVDALSFFQPVGQQAEATGVGTILISPARGDVPALQDPVHGALFTTQGVLDRKPEAVAAFLRAIARAEETIAGDPAQVRELLSGYLGALEPATVDALVPVLQAEIPSSPEVTEAAYQESADFHRTSGLVEDPPAYAEVVATDAAG